MGLTGAHAPGATPLEPGDIVGLKPRHVTTWHITLVAAGPGRDAYIAALQSADRGDFAALSKFVRS